MAVKVTCPQCQAGLKLAEAPKPGKGVTCPNCKLKFVPPEPTAWVDESGSGRSYLPWVIVALLVGAGVGGVTWHQLTNPEQETAPAVVKALSSEQDSEQLQAKLEIKSTEQPGSASPAANPSALIPAPMPVDVAPKQVVPMPEPVVPMPKPPAPAPPKGDDVPDVPMPKKTPPKSTYAETKRPVVDEKPAPAPLVNARPQPVVADHPKQKQVNEAIDKGIAYLKSIQLASGTWPRHAGGNNFDLTKVNYEVGFAALGGLTLLECRVPTDDANVQKAAAFVRSSPINDPMHRTYQMSCAVLFLDRLGDPRDRGLIQRYALQLVAGQGERGGWSYDCPDLNNAELKQLLTFLQATRVPVADGDKDGAQAPAKAKPNVPAFQNLAQSVRMVPTVFRYYRPKDPIPRPILNPFRMIEDNSNSQFAMLALWAARRHEVPTERTLVTAGQRYVASQLSSGGWDYHSGGSQMVMPEGGPKLPGPQFPGPVPKGAPNPLGVPFAPMPVATFGGTPSMTCVGLLGLAMGHASLPAKAAANAKLPDDNPAVAKGLEKLGAHVDVQDMRNFYFLWSLERVCMLYNLKTLGNKDWYDVGVEMLLPTQREDGSWTSLENYPGSAASLDTCFALLFLKRSNLVQDLTERLPFLMSISDPGVRPPRR